VDGLLTAR
jgi:hypothetical protein